MKAVLQAGPDAVSLLSKYGEESIQLIGRYGQVGIDQIISGEDAYKIAKAGGRYSGDIRNLLKQGVTKNQLESAIHTFQGQILEHCRLLSDPAAWWQFYGKDKQKNLLWHQLDPREQMGLLRKWQRDINRLTEQQGIRRGYLYDNF